MPGAGILVCRDSLADDPAQDIGSTKELLETVFKTVLGMHGARIGNKEVPKLLKRTQATLDLDPADVDGSIPRAEFLRSLKAIGIWSKCDYPLVFEQWVRATRSWSQSHRFTRPRALLVTLPPRGRPLQYRPKGSMNGSCRLFCT